MLNRLIKGPLFLGTFNNLVSKSHWIEEVVLNLLISFLKKFSRILFQNLVDVILQSMTSSSDYQRALQIPSHLLITHFGLFCL